MNYWRIEIDLDLSIWSIYGNNFKECFLEFERVDEPNFTKKFAYRYLVYPREWIKYENAKMDGFVTYTSKYYSPKEILQQTFENYTGTITNTYTNELLYKH